MNTEKNIIERLNVRPTTTKSFVGKGGVQMTYVPTEAVVDLLNDAAGMEWQFRIVNTQFIDGYILVHAALSIQGTTREATGGKAITKMRGSDVPLDLGNDYKSACSLVLKKAASLFGVRTYIDENEEEPISQDQIDEIIRLDQRIKKHAIEHLTKVQATNIIKQLKETKKGMKNEN